MKNLTTPAVEKSPTRIYAEKLESAEAAVQRARDIACVFAYLTQDIQGDETHIQLDLQALRGVMGRIWGDLDEALGSFREAHELFSEIAKKSNS